MYARIFPLSRAGLLFSLTLFALLLAEQPVVAERLPIRVYTSADGLGSSFVNDLKRDSRGFMWFCTRDGLSRFDGSKFVTYQIAAKDSAPGIENIYEARDGTYWITTTGGMYHFDPNKATSQAGGTPILNAERIGGYRGEFFEDKKGNFWFGAGGLFRIEDGEDGKKVVNRFILGLPQRQDVEFGIADLSESSDGSLWINSSWGLIRRLPDEKIVYYIDEALEPVMSGAVRMIIDKSGRVWATRGNRFFVIKPEPLDAFQNAERVTVKPLTATAQVEVKPDSPVRFPKLGGEIYQLRNPEFIDKTLAKNVFQTSDGTVWMTAEDKLAQITEGNLKLYTGREGLPSVLGRMAEDNVSNLWIATRSGVVRLDRSGLVSFGSQDGAAADRFLSVNEGRDGSVYFGNPDAAITSFSDGKLSSARPGLPPGMANIWTSRTVLNDSRGDWWVLTGDGLYRFSGVSNIADLKGRKPTARYGVNEGLKSNGIFQIFEDSQGDIWVSTRGSEDSGHGLGRMHPGETKFTSFSEESGFPPGNSASSFAEDKNGNLWIGFYEGGVARFDGERFRVFGPDDGIPQAGVITDLHVDSKGRLWLSSASAGMLRVDDPGSEKPEFHQISTENGLSSNNIRTITEDRFGRIYLGNARGVDRYSPDTGHVKHFSTVDGLAADFVVDSLCDTKGDCWFATDGGLSRFTPTPEEKSAPPKILLGGLRIAGVAQPTLELGSSNIETPELSDAQNNLQIDYFGVDFRAGESLRYQYLLEGADADWSAPTDLTTVTFPNLKPESYRFLVRAVNSDGVVSEVPATVSFTIVPPLWQRTWFQLLVVVAVAGITAFVFYYRTAKLREINVALREAKVAEQRLRRVREERLAELEKVRARIATDLHDDIGASLTQIAILSEVAQTQANGNGSAAESLAKITDVSNELVGTMGDIVWSINPAKDHFSDLVQRMRRFAADVFASKSIEFQFLAPGTEGETVVSSNIRREVFLIFKEAVNNIVRHSRATSVRIELAVENGEVAFRVFDNGVGFDTANPKPSSGGHGIVGMRKRVEELGGKLQIISEAGTGTTIALSLPLHEPAVG
jgi:signal transduction histidine kinase/ligand-binding sensor domain-containing protein